MMYYKQKQGSSSSSRGAAAAGAQQVQVGLQEDLLHCRVENETKIQHW